MATLKDEDMRLAAKRLADAILRLAHDPTTKHSTLPSKYGFDDGVAESSTDRVVIIWAGDHTHIKGRDADGNIPIGFAIEESLIDRNNPTIPHRPIALLQVAKLVSDWVAKNRALAHDEPHIVLGDDTIWATVATMLQQASSAYPDLKLRLAGAVEPGVHLEITAKGAQGVIGPSAELKRLISTLDRAPMLSWKRAMSPQALAKRRDNGVPPMGRAIIQRATVAWAPHDGRPQDDGASHIQRPAVPVARIAPVAVADKDRFDWTVDDWDEVTLFADLKGEIQRALLSILIVNERTLMQQLHLIRRKGRWVQRWAPSGAVPELSCADATALLDARILERRGDMLVAGYTYHRLLEGLIATGYDSWAGVTEIRRVERVPNGIKYEPEGRYHYWPSDKGNVARLTTDGFTIERLGFNPKTPALARNGYAKEGLKPTDPLIAIIMENGTAWPDFTRNMPAEIDGRIGIACDPELDGRHLPGPLGELYRAPAADRSLIQRNLRWKSNRFQLPAYSDWLDEEIDDYC